MGRDGCTARRDTPAGAIGLLLLGAGPCTTGEVVACVSGRWPLPVMLAALRAMEADGLIRRVDLYAGAPCHPLGNPIMHVMWALAVDTTVPAPIREG
jgi:hypothetical protein